MFFIIMSFKYFLIMIIMLLILDNMLNESNWKTNQHVKTHMNAKYWLKHPDEFEKHFGIPYNPKYNKMWEKNIRKELKNNSVNHYD